MSNWWIIGLIICLSTITYILRSLPILYLSSKELPEDLKNWLKYIPPSIFAALIVPDLVLIDGSISLINPKSIAGIIALLIAYKTKSLTATILAGVGVLVAIMYL